MDPKYLKPGDMDFCASHVVEECGEVLMALGKIQRWGWLSSNPELPLAEQETNLDWLKREMADLRSAMDRLDSAIYETLDAPKARAAAIRAAGEGGK